MRLAADCPGRAGAGAEAGAVVAPQRCCGCCCKSRNWPRGCRLVRWRPIRRRRGQWEICARRSWRRASPHRRTALLERLRGNEDESILREAAAELMQQPLPKRISTPSSMARSTVCLRRKRDGLLRGSSRQKASKLGLAGLERREATVRACVKHEGRTAQPSSSS